MANQYDGPDSRVDQIVEFGRGITGAPGSGGLTFSTHAQLIAIPAGTFRRAPAYAPVDDPRLDGLDRAFDTRWETGRDEWAEANENDAQSLIRARLRVRVLYLYGQAMPSGSMDSQGAESPAVTIVEPTRRALGDAERIKRALTYSDLWSGSDIDPVIWLLRRDGETTLQQLPMGGRLVATTYYTVGITRNNAHAYAP